MQHARPATRTQVHEWAKINQARKARKAPAVTVFAPLYLLSLKAAVGHMNSTRNSSYISTADHDA
jgi:hypothetical protein